ncbi:MAG: transposase, partial [Chloroflexi bacterium]|nr:transposase [Chloroflexota bacterium]
HLAQAIADVGLYEFGRQVTYKAAWAGSEVLVADRWYPSSKRCSQCGAVKDTLGLSERVYSCVCCGLVIDRDLNAACNLAQLAPTASSAGSQACREERLQPLGSAPRGSRNRTAV